MQGEGAQQQLLPQHCLALPLLPPAGLPGTSPAPPLPAWRARPCPLLQPYLQQQAQEACRRGVFLVEALEWQVWRQGRSQARPLLLLLPLLPAKRPGWRAGDAPRRRQP